MASQDCEGIPNGENSEISSDLHEIMTNLIINEVHKSGENANYEELHEMLEHVEPELFDAYEKELFSMYKRDVVFSDCELTVLDTFQPNFIPTRTLHFNDRKNLIQSEVYLKGEDSEIDHSKLVLDVHRAMAMVFPLYGFANGPEQKNKESDIISVAVLGAGACTLPNFIKHRFVNAKIDAIDTSKSVLKVAREYFGTGSEIKLHNEDALDYMDRCDNTNFDVVFVDVDSGSLGPHGIAAPPAAFLEDSFLISLKSSVRQKSGVVVMNVITPHLESLNWLKSRLQETGFGNQRVISLPKNHVIFASVDQETNEDLNHVISFLEPICADKDDSSVVTDAILKSFDRR